MKNLGFMKKSVKACYMSPDQLQQREIYVIHVCESDLGIYPRTARKAALAIEKAEGWPHLNQGNTKWNWTETRATETVLLGTSQDQTMQHEDAIRMKSS